MEAATFFVDHLPSNSRAAVEYGLVKKKVVLLGVWFVRGNTIDINAVRFCHNTAKKILLGWDPIFFPSG